MKKVILLSTTMMIAPFVAGDVAAQCVATADCASLGYTEASCPNGGLKCPFGTTWSCKGDGTTAKANCEVGWILYSDKTCSSTENRDITKTPIGVVFYKNPNGGGIALALKPVAQDNLTWSSKYIVSPLSGKNREDALNDFSSCENTKKILENGDETVYPAAWAAYNYTTDGTKKGDWCLPTLGTIYLLSEQANKMKETYRAINLNFTESWQDYYTSSLASEFIYVDIALYGSYNIKTNALWYKEESNYSLRSVYRNSAAYSDRQVDYTAHVYPVIEF